MEHTPTRGDTIVLDGKSQTLECVRLRFDAHDELVAALTTIMREDPNGYFAAIAANALAKVSSSNRS